MPYFLREGAKIFYEAGGERGDWVTLINGHMRPSSDFGALTRRLQEVSFRVLRLDNRGAGKTECSLDFTLADMADDVSDLWQYLGIQASHVVGISMGGLIAQTVVRRTAISVRSLALISTARLGSSAIKFSEAWPADAAGVEARLGEYVSAAFLERNRLLVTSMAKGIAKEVRENRYNERAQAQRRAVVDAVSNAGIKSAAATMVMHGDQDAVIPLAEARALAKDVGASLRIVAGAGHLLLAERAPELTQGLLDHLNQA